VLIPFLFSLIFPQLFIFVSGILLTTFLTVILRWPFGFSVLLTGSLFLLFSKNSFSSILADKKFYTQMALCDTGQSAWLGLKYYSSLVDWICGCRNLDMETQQYFFPSGKQSVLTILPPNPQNCGPSLVLMAHAFNPSSLGG
jgi:hypothetical protein